MTPAPEYMVDDYEREDWQDSPLVESLARVAAILEAQGRYVPRTLLTALQDASAAGRPVDVA